MWCSVLALLDMDSSARFLKKCVLAQKTCRPALPSSPSLGLGLFVCGHVASLGINPTTWNKGGNVLCREVILFTIDHVFLHEFVQLVKVVKRDHRVQVMFGMKVGIPQEDTDEKIGADRTCVTKTIGDLGNFTIGMFEVAEVVHHGVSNQDGDDPPKKNGFQTRTSLTNSTSHGKVERKLHKSGTLKFGHDSRFLGVVEFLETPSRAGVVDGNTHGGTENATGTTLEGGENVEETHEVGVATGGHVTETRILERFPRIEAGEFRILVDMVGERVMLFVHDTFMFSQLETKDTHKEEGPIIDPLGLPGIAVKEFMLAGKGKALELESVEKVERKEHEEFR